MGDNYSSSMRNFKSMLNPLGKDKLEIGLAPEVLDALV